MFSCLALACSGNDAAPTGPTGPAVSVTINPAPDSLIVGSAIQLNAVVKDVADSVLPGWPLRWASSDTTLAIASPNGVVTAVRPGTVLVIASSASGAASADTVPLRLLPRAAGITITPRPGSLVISDSVQLFAVVVDSNGAVLTGRVIRWGVAGNGEAGTDGLVRAKAGGSLLVIAEVEDQIDSLRIPTIVDSPFSAIASGDQHTCALTSSGRAYCWGNGFVGQLGDPAFSIAVSPNPVDPSLRFVGITAAGSHTCGVTGPGDVYCWGYNSYGQVGTSADEICGAPCRRVTAPQRVASLPAVVAVSAGFEHTCAATGTGLVWCWGLNSAGQLGRGESDLLFNPTPDTVRSLGPASAAVGGAAHSCALTSGGVAKCWGGNAVGQLGIGTSDAEDHFDPAPVAGGLAFAQLSAGQAYTCGVTSGEEGWCWGRATDGRLGSGSVPNQEEPSPLPIAGGHAWRSLSANAEHTCGVTTNDIAYCWGNSTFLATGNSGGPTPQPVDGSLAFLALAAGHYHTCGISTAGIAYCWGTGIDGQLGTASLTSSATPVRVDGQL